MAVKNPGKIGARNAPKYEDYTIVDIGGSWTPVKNHVIAWAVNNVLDKDTAVFEKSGTSSGACGRRRGSVPSGGTAFAHCGLRKPNHNHHNRNHIWNG